LPLDFRETGRRRRGILLAQCKIALRRSQIGSRGFQKLPVRFPLGFQSRQPVTSLGQLGLSGRRPDHQLGAAFLIVLLPGMRAIDFHRDLRYTVTVFTQFRFD